MFWKKISSSRNACWIYQHVQWYLIIHFYLYRMDVIVRIPRLYIPGKLHLQILLFPLLLRKNELKTCNLKINHGILRFCILDGCLFSFYFFSDDSPPSFCLYQWCHWDSGSFNRVAKIDKFYRSNKTFVLFFLCF